MEYPHMFSVGFYSWWLLLNGILYLAEFYFIRSFTGIQEKKYMVCYVLTSGLLTFLAMYFQSSGVLRLILHMGIILCFSRFVLKLTWAETVAPAMIILTLFTFMEGFQTVFMRWLAGHSMKMHTAVFMQMLLSGGLAAVLLLTLHFVSKRYAYTGRQKLSAYMYPLLLPCSFIVWVIRSGLGLDMWMEPAFRKSSFWEKRQGLWALIWILGACVIFFIILRLVSRILALSVQETEQKRLEDQIRKQYTYLEEAKKRNEQYRTFQHDINNHFLVLSGLIREKRYEEAEIYFDKLHGSADRLLIGIETGNPILDILLQEKISFAVSSGIEVKHDVQIPPDCGAEDMDLCVILANALDNAVHACRRVAGRQPEISVIVRRRHHFLIIEVVNTMVQAQGRLEYGTGLNNIRRTAEKYEGTMEIENDGETFRLTVLLCLAPFTKAG